MALNAITVNECQALLNNGNCKVLGSQSRAWSADIRGHLGEYFQLQIHYENLLANNKPSTMTYFVKTVTKKGLLPCMSDIDLPAKEIFAYKFVNEVKKLIPAVDISMVPELKSFNQDGTLILEDLSVTGYKGPEELLLTRLEILKCLEAVAKFHAVSIAYQEYKSKELGRRFEIPEECDMKVLHPTFVADKDCSGYRYLKSSELATYELVKEVYKDDTTKREFLLKRIPESFKNFVKLLNDKNNYYKVLAHADLWAFNTLFKYSENGEPLDCKLVDFQIIRYAPPAHDITMLLYSVTTETIRQKYLQQFYQHYYNALEEQLRILEIDLKDVFTWEEFDTTCRVYMESAKLIWMVKKQLSSVNPQRYHAAQKDDKEYEEIILGSKRAEYVMENFRQDPEYKKNVTRILTKYAEVLLGGRLAIEEVFKIMSNKLDTCEYKLIGYDLKMSDVVIGFMGSHGYLQVDVEVENDDVDQNNTKVGENNIIKFNFFVKLLPEVESQIAFSSQTGASVKEMKFYGTIVPHMVELGLKEILDVAPRCYLANTDALVFDNLVLENYQVPRARDNMPLNDVKKGLACLAKLHACTMLYEEELGKIYGDKEKKLSDIYPAEFSKTFYSGEIEMPRNMLNSYKTGTCRLIDLFLETGSEIPSKDLKQLAQDFIEEYSTNVRPSKKYRNCICHGDLWAANLMISDHDAKCIDFQSYRYSPPMQDVTQFIYFSLYKKDRVLYWDNLLDFYYAEFKKVFENHNLDVEIDRFLSKDVFLDGIKFYGKFAAMQSITHFQTTLLGPEALKMFFGNSDGSKESMFGDRTKMIDYNCKFDSFYECRLRDAMMDFLDICESQCLS